MNDIRRYVPELPTFRFRTIFNEDGTYSEDDIPQDHECITYKRDGWEYFAKTPSGTEVKIRYEKYPDKFVVDKFGPINFTNEREYGVRYEEYEEFLKRCEKLDVDEVIPVVGPPNPVYITPNAHIIMKNIQVKSEGYDPILIFTEGRAYVMVINEGGHNSCVIDLSDLLNWFRINTPDILK